ncbi:MAG TPA: tetratricopeptide repeat protein [Terracidiphilus sp.]|nr:tetratricopeptide repeat protein [Terracidiphilus sp.]
METLSYPLHLRVSALALLVFALTAAAGQSSHPAAGDADEHMRRGVDAQQHGDVKAAIEEYRKALAMRPRFPEARANLGAALAAVGDFDGAIREDRLAMENAPDKVAVRKNLALAYYKKGDCEHAAVEFDAVHAARPGDLGATMLLGYCELKLNRAEKAVTLLEPLEQANQNDPDFEYVLGSALIQTGKEAEGAPRMERVARTTRSAEAYVIAGSARLSLRQFKDARADLDAALELDTQIPGLYTMAGQARDALGDTEAAQQAFEAALRADARDPMANLYLGAILLKKREVEKAEPLLTLALQLQPENRHARLQMAKLDAMQGKNAEAVALLEALEKADPNWLEPHVELAPLYYKLHRGEDGQRERKIVDDIQAKQQEAGPPKD